MEGFSSVEKRFDDLLVLKNLEEEFYTTFYPISIFHFEEPLPMALEPWLSSAPDFIDLALT
jgi:hypothetical protein